MRKPVSIRTLVLGTFYLALLILLVGLTASAIWQKQEFLEEHLRQSSQDAATSLALSISAVPGEGDWVVASSMIDAIFDSGAYALVSLHDLEGHAVFTRQAGGSIIGVPAWFVALVELQTPRARAEVVSGWRKLGHLEVQVHPATAYRELWQGLRSELLWFAIIAVATGLLFRLFLHQLLVPLHRLALIAERIREKDFSHRMPPPPLRELAEVSEAINLMAERLALLFGQQLQTIEQLRRQTLTDALTELDNRDNFDRRLQAMLQSEEGEGQGVLALLQVGEFARVNQVLGRRDSDALLRAFADLLVDEVSGTERALLGRREGAQFAIYLPFFGEDAACALCERLLGRLRRLPALAQLGFELPLHAGCMPTGVGGSVPEALAGADFALRQAQRVGSMVVRCYLVGEGQDARPRAASEWQGLLQAALREHRFAVFFQPMFDAGRQQILFHQVLLRLPVQERLLSAGEFLPMAERFALMPELDRWVLQQALVVLEADPGGSVLSVSLSSALLQGADLGAALRDLLRRHARCTPRLILEIPEHALRPAWAGVDQLLMLRKEYGFRIVVNHFGMSGMPFGYLESWPVDLIKLDPALVGQIDSNPAHQFYVRNIVQIAHSRDVQVVVVGVERREEAETLQGLGVDGLMGYYLCRPQASLLHLN